MGAQAILVQGDPTPYWFLLPSLPCCSAMSRRARWERYFEGPVSEAVVDELWEKSIPALLRMMKSSGRSMIQDPSSKVEAVAVMLHVDYTDVLTPDPSGSDDEVSLTRLEEKYPRWEETKARLLLVKAYETKQESEIVIARDFAVKWGVDGQDLSRVMQHARQQANAR